MTFNNSIENRNLVFFDIETQKSFDEVGGRKFFHKLGLSVAVTYCTQNDTYSSYFEADVENLISELKNADLVIGFNIQAFDYVVLQPYTRFKLFNLKSFDILSDIHHRLGFRISLDSLASSTLGTQKLADGLQAIEWYKTGKFDDLVEYCKKDVEITRQLYMFGKMNKYILYYDKYQRSVLKLPVEWP